LNLILIWESDFDSIGKAKRSAVTKQGHDLHRGHSTFKSVQIRGKKFLVSSPARTAASAAIPSAATRPSTAPAASAISTTTARPSTASTTVSAMRTVSMGTIPAAHRRSTLAIEVRLIIGKIASAFNHHRSSQRRSGNRFSLVGTTFNRRRAISSAHLRALLFQNRFAR
jgi:hypothetical protein